ncbi:hypothetical protein HCUR_01220 [Holospora curviuscula]|uniref:Uncharacterized protein n=1 Tax=Holospora curviuscula TaxID=1082868 RepID=A0A2S5R7P0_9PROT|nr:hypothetical protein HCUR_01220 [Holospora curviuscula]
MCLLKRVLVLNPKCFPASLGPFLFNKSEIRKISRKIHNRVFRRFYGVHSLFFFMKRGIVHENNTVSGQVLKKILTHPSIKHRCVDESVKQIYDQKNTVQ